ncbi:MAG: alkaline phosphatase family protein [Opitutaceae bacterium]|nr:alkaline phosphatase family protein [Opitutaceae bacterium]
MTPPLFRRPWLSLTAAAMLAAHGSEAAADHPPRLAVAIAVDQLRYDYLLRFRPFFVEGGFERLLSGGTNFENCTYRYAATKTAVGHATMLSGCNPEVHGIVGNDWIDPDTLVSGASVEDHESPLVGLAPTTMRLPGGALDPRSGRSPRRLLAATIGDQLKATYGAEARVFGVSNKDRSAILMAGARADGAYWDENGRFVTSTYYREALPDWVEAFNDRHFVESCFGKTWERLLDPADYVRIQGPDDAEAEMVDKGLDRTFPHVIDGGIRYPGPAFYGAFDNAPFASEFLAAFAREIIERENLGADAVPDLLCVSFSQIDSIGHNYGPDSHEIMDSIVRLDRILAGFFAYLDRRIGPDRYVVVLTADHAVAPLPERMATDQSRVPAARIRAREIDARMKVALDAEFGPLPEGMVWFIRDNQGYHLHPAALDARNLERATVARALHRALLGDPVVETAFTRAEILAAPTEGTSLPALVRRSYCPSRGQDVLFVLPPFSVERSELFGTNHGTPWIYDRHVPQLWYGAGVARGWRAEPVGMEDIAPTLAALLAIPPPPQATGQRRF